MQPQAPDDDWDEEDEAFLQQLENAMEQQQAQDAQEAAQEAAAQQQQQLEQQIWWDWVQAIRDGLVPAPAGWQDPSYPNPYRSEGTSRGILFPQAVQAVQTRGVAQAELVRRYMPTLAELRRAVLATHLLYLYLDANSDKSDAWAHSWRAGDVNYVPYNHFAAINFVEANESMIQKAVELMQPLQSKLRTPSLLLPEELRFLQNWIVAREMLAKLGELNTHARVWKRMRNEYGEWSAPRER